MLSQNKLSSDTENDTVYIIDEFIESKTLSVYTEKGFIHKILCQQTHGLQVIQSQQREQASTSVE